MYCTMYINFVLHKSFVSRNFQAQLQDLLEAGTYISGHLAARLMILKRYPAPSYSL